ncbi:hypothetical protein BCR44DRAFT_123716 [Catenaria anguillulae PL171]|uniref:EF-hand domain-containing protein n=1 Tax=Catenaria anguillulae PL171 TaxID=765915 RepID=A0A1Y2I482_9FUNG|nr:hypothetical protein BCR44DRAFT_123716 [Catenaria anguillulae PL171]
MISNLWSRTPTVFADTLSEYWGSNQPRRKRLVILGSGWGATAMLRNLDRNAFEVVIVSPTNNFFYTPLLPSACVGTVEDRSLVEPIRRIASGVRAKYVYGTAEDVDLDKRQVVVKSIDNTDVLVDYDMLVVAVGSDSNTFGLKGVAEHCHFLKTVQDARAIRKQIIHNFEIASLPTTPADERKRLLTFVVCGGGPTGTEVAGEFWDFWTEDLIQYYPELKKDVSVHLIQSGDHILSSFDASIGEYTERKFQRSGIDVIKNSRVNSVEEGRIGYLLTHPDKSKTQEYLPFGFCLWSTGIAMRPITLKLQAKIAEQQHTRTLLTSSGLQIKGAPPGVYAIGDCATIENPKLLDRLTSMFAEADTNRDGGLSLQEFEQWATQLRAKQPLAAQHLRFIATEFERLDANGDKKLSVDEFKQLLGEVDKQLKSLPATAQVASQQGRYLAKKLSCLPPNPTSDDLVQLESARPGFDYKHLGSLAYIGGDAAVADFGSGRSMSGVVAAWLWRGAHLGEQVGFRTRMMLAADWFKHKVFGRDISDL